MRHQPFRNDLIIGMTLAEIFLLLLIVGWYGSRLESEAATREPSTPTEILQKRLDDANKALQRAEEEKKALESTIGNLKSILDWLGERLGAPQPVHDTPSAISDGGWPQYWSKLLGSYTTGVKRGKPICGVTSATNVLVKIEDDDSKLTLNMLQPLTVDGVEFAIGQMLSEQQDIDHFVQMLQKYYSERRDSGHECVFDYTLAWRTDHDFRISKKRFDLVFYPAGDRQLQ
jgi:hypothetical protein